MNRVVNLFSLFVLINLGSSSSISPPTLLGKFLNDDETTNYRLPNNSRPISYDLWLKTDVDKQIFDFQGNVKIAIKIFETTTSIVLHLRLSEIDHINLVNDDGSIQDLTEQYAYELEREFLTITLPIEVSTDDEILLDITYHGVLRDDKGGFYYASYIDENNETIWYGTTQFEMTDARHVMPCYDEPGIRAPISLRIEHTENYFAISNMPVVNITKSTTDGYVITFFEETPEMQTYLLAFLISNFKFKSNNDTRVSQVEQRVYAIPQAIDDGEGDFALSVVDSVLTGLETHLNVRYPLAKMDHAAITDFEYGAMENFGLITYVDYGLLWKPQSDPESKKKNILELISHEYTHQYFGNIVSPSWWQYTWLNEGFASLFGAVIPSKIYPEEDFIYRFHVGAQAQAFNIDKEESVPLNHYIQTPVDIRNKFDGISYSKGASMLRMFQQALGEETFAKGLQYYLEEMHFKSATPTDLHRNIQKAYNETVPGNTVNIDRMMSTWENQAGYPIIYIRKFLNIRNMTEFEFNQTSSTGRGELYSVPITFITNVTEVPSNKPKFWIENKLYSVEVEADYDEAWILVNLFQNGYYKVLYSPDIWDQLVKEYSKFPTMNQVKIFDEIPINIADSVTGLELLKHLDLENKESIVWQRVEKIESWLSERYLGSEIQDQYDKFITSLIEPQLERLGYEDKPQESYKDADIRRIVVALNCKVLNETCLEFKLKQFLKNPQSYPKSELCAAFRLMDLEIYNSLTLTDEEKISFIPYHACSLDREMLERSFVHFFTSDPDVNIFDLIHNAMTTEFGARTILDFMSREIEILPQL